MSLGLCVVQKNFILASTDTAVTNFPIDDEKYSATGEIVRTGDMIKTELKSKKLLKLSDKVLLIATGNSILTDVIEAELFNRLDNYSDLNECREVSQEVITNLRNGQIKYWDDIKFRISKWLPEDEMLEDVEKEVNFSIKLIDNKLDFSAYLSGFNDDGSSGLVDIKADTLTLTPEDQLKGYPIFIAGGSDKFNLNEPIYKEAFSVQVDERTIETFVERMVFIHANISFESPINVSSDCNFCLLLKTEEGITYTEFTIETSDFYEFLGLYS